jgi:very-short-patch-repair endonuclease
MAAILTCGDGAVLSHESAAELWELHSPSKAPIQISVPARVAPQRKRIVVHRRVTLNPVDVTSRSGIPVTTPVSTLIDLAAILKQPRVERLINEADKRELTTPELLRAALESYSSRRPGVATLRTILDEQVFVLTDSELERYFLPMARLAGLGLPETGCLVHGFRVDFFWAELGLIVETDGLRYHRTPAQQARDRVRDQTHIAAGLTPLRFTHYQIRYQPDYVVGVLGRVVRQLRKTRQR